MKSWNRFPLVQHHRVVDHGQHTALLPDSLGENASLLPYGNGRSYGDVCLNESGTLVRTRGLDRYIGFDRASGRLICESGLLLDDLLALVVPQGWFPPVTPGTRFVTVGGAIANDVHGKNHHVSGSFGHHVVRFELLRSNGERLTCCRQENPDWFHATVGGLGLTGLITWAEIQLAPVANPLMATETRRFGNLDAFWELNAEAESQWPYTVAWIDCLAQGKRRGRGMMMLGRHAAPQERMPAWRERTRRFPVDPPFSLVNGLSLRLFNTAYFHRPIPRGTRLVHYAPYFYPLDGILEWNRLYGRKGFFQYQCVLPPEHARAGMDELLRRIGLSGTGSFLAVLKTFGARPADGMLSFPRPGATLALDFSNQGERTLRLFHELDAVVRDAGGALYPAKDARMPGEMFRLSYPDWERYANFIDPRFSSSFWRRVAG